MFLTVNISLDFFFPEEIYLEAFKTMDLLKTLPSLPASWTITMWFVVPQISHLLCSSTVWLYPPYRAVELISLPWPVAASPNTLRKLQRKCGYVLPQIGHKKPCSFCFGPLECTPYRYSLGTFMLGTKLPWIESSKPRWGCL